MVQYTQLGQSGLTVSRVALGLWQADLQSWGSDYDEADVIATIHAAPDHGVTLLDTAPGYGGGASETLLGRALVGRRDRYVVATKVSPQYYRRDGVRECVHGSLQRLGLETIDLIQVHWPNGAGEPFAEQMAALAELRDEGKVRALGVSNFSAAQLAECLQTTRLDSLQPPYNLLWRHVERDLVPFCRDHALSVLPYSPLAQGLLSGKYHRGNRPADGNRPRNLLWHGTMFDRCLAVVEVLREIAAAHSASCAQTALAWLLHQPGVTSVLAGAKRPAQVADNAHAAEIALSPTELAQLDQASAAITADTAAEPKMWFVAPGQSGAYDVR